jgi:hypothetical protein
MYPTLSIQDSCLRKGIFVRIITFTMFIATPNEERRPGKSEKALIPYREYIKVK